MSDDISPVLVARAELEPCLASLRSMAVEGGGLLLMVGPAGLGKSTLARSLQRRWGSGHEIMVRATHPDLEPALGMWSRLASLADLDDALSRQATQSDRFTAHDRFTSVVRLLRHLATQGATPIVFDDLHAADPDSLTLLAQVAPLLSATGATIIATSRGADAVADDLGQAAHRALESQAQVHVLAPFEPFDVGLWLTRYARTSTVAPDLVDLFWRESAGNPLLVERLLHECWPQGSSPPDHGCVLAASTGPSVVDRWRRELGRLSPDDRLVVAVVAELGPWATVPTITEVLQRSSCAGVFDRLAAHGLVAPVGVDGEVRLAHPAIDDALAMAESLLAPEVHARLARQIALVGAEVRTVLHHMVRAGACITSQERRRTALEVVHQAERRGDVRAAAEAWDVVLAGDASPGDTTRCDVVLQAAEAWQRAGDRRRARELAWIVARDGDPRDADALARAALIAADGAEFHGEAAVAVALLHRARQLLERHDTAPARRRLVEVLAALAPLEMTLPVTGPRPPVTLDAVQLDAVDAVRWHWVTRPDVAQPRAVEAERLAAQIGDPVLEALTGLVWRATHLAPEHAVERRRRADRARQMLVGRRHEARAVHAVLLDALEAGAVADVQIALGELADLAATTGDPSVRWRYAYTSAMLDSVAGRSQQAEAASDTAGRYGVMAGEPTAVIVRLEQRTLLALDRLDDLDTVLALGRRLDSVSHPPLLAGVVHLLGELQRAGVRGASVDREVVREVVAHLASPAAREQNWGITVAFTASAVATLGDVELAERLLVHADQVRHHVARESSGITCLGHQGAFLGALQFVVGDREAARTAVEAAQQWNERVGFLRAGLASRLTLLEARRHELSDADLRHQARDLAAAASRRHLHFLAARARRLGRGLAEVTLSARQREVLQGLADGATYQQIADRIGYSHGTVRGEVTVIYDRLGVEHRQAAVEEAEWWGLVAPSKKQR